MTEKKKKRLIVEHRDGYMLVYPAGKKPPRMSKSPLKPLDYFVGASLEDGDLVYSSKKELKQHAKNKKAKK